MGSITPKNNEYNLLSSFVEEALSLLGQECKVYLVRDNLMDTIYDSIVGKAVVGKAKVSALREEDITCGAIVGKAIVGKDKVGTTRIDATNIYETPSDSILYYDEPVQSFILFEDDLRDVKLKQNSWSKETDLELIAYVSLSDLYSLSKNCLVEVTPSFYNRCSSWLITDIYGQVNSTYARVRLVPYRKSLRTDLDPAKDVSTEVNIDGIITRKKYLKR